jgi:hypothetical protein
MANQQAAELTEPGIGSLDDPSAFVAVQFAAIFVAPLFVVAPIGRDQLDAAFLQTFPQRVRIIGSVGNHPLRLLLGTAFGARDVDFGECGFRKTSFSRRGTLQPNSQRKTLTVDQYHPRRALATLRFIDRSAPFLAGAKLPSMKHSSPFSRPSPSRAPSSARRALSQTSSSSHCLSRRQQVAGEGYSSDRNRQAAPVCGIHRMPSKHARFDAQGRPRLSPLPPRRGARAQLTPTVHRSIASAASSWQKFNSQPASRVST